jgi:membrane protease YdiL (CAAX protease family)
MLTTGVESRGRIRAEILIVLALSLGASAVYSIVDIVDLLTQPKALGEQTTTLNNSLDSRQYFDLVYQILGIVFALAPVVLVGFLLWQTTKPHLERLGLDGSRWWRDSLWGLALAAAIGIPGLAFYLLSRTVGINVDVHASALAGYWWTVPVLLLSAIRSGVQEEVIMIGYLYSRLRDLGWGTWRMIIVSALIRGSYHLYQGFGAFIGNAVMGVAFGWLYHRFGRLLPLVVAHSLMDAAVFVGYPWAAATFPSLFG